MLFKGLADDDADDLLDMQDQKQQLVQVCNCEEILVCTFPLNMTEIY